MKHLELNMHGAVAVLTFNNPPLQVMTPQTINELSALLPKLEEDQVRAVVITGSDDEYFIRHFSVEELDASTKGQGSAWEAGVDETLFRLEHLLKPVLVALNGSAAGGGLELALACDIRVAKDGPFHFGLPEITVGILPGAGGTQRLPELVGRHRALEMMLRPRLISPSEALVYGMIEELVPADTPETALDRAVSIAQEIASRPTQAVASIKQLARGAVSPVVMDQLILESRMFGQLMKTPEARELMADVARQQKIERQTK